jgi:hypothetical protein
VNELPAGISFLPFSFFLPAQRRHPDERSEEGPASY